MGPGGEAVTMMGSMAGFVLTLSCLNDEEWEIASPRLGLGPEDRESLQCVMSKLGGPEGIAEALQPKDGEPPLAYINAATACGLQTAGAPPGPGMPAGGGMSCQEGSTNPWYQEGCPHPRGDFHRLHTPSKS